MIYEISEQYFNDGSCCNVYTPVMEEYDDVIPYISSAWKRVIESKTYQEFLENKKQLDEFNSILFKAVDKTRRHTRQTCEEYKNYRKTLPSYKYKTTGNPIGRPKIRDKEYWKEYRKSYYNNVVKPKRLAKKQDELKTKGKL